ncbi:MAG TPA: sigma-70 family RNA polymerase sigma factor [Micromonosporaceae bacterium]
MTFEDFVRAELVALTRFAGALAGDRALAEDILSDALLKVIHRWRRISGMHDPAAYVRRVVVTTYLSQRRTAKRRRTDPVGDLSATDRAVPDASAEVVARAEVEWVLAKLPPQQKAAVVLRYLLDQTDEQIAEALGCTPATVRSHLSHARAALRLTAPATTTKE